MVTSSVLSLSFLFGTLAFIWIVFEKGESVASSALKARITQWLKGDPVRVVAGWLSTFPEVFDHVFGARHLSWKCFRRSCLASLGTVLAVTLYWATSRPKEVAAIFAASHVASAALSYFVLTLLLSFVPDYLSLLKSRRLIGWMNRKRSAGSLCLGVLLDLLLTMMLVGAAFYAYFLLRQFVWYGRAMPLGLMLRLPLYLAVVFMFLSSSLSAAPGLLPVGIWAWATLFTTAWATSYAVASRVMWKKRNGAFFRVDEVHDQPAAWQGGHRRNAPWARVSGSHELRMSPSGSRWAS